jgi:hypothetical protein
VSRRDLQFKLAHVQRGACRMTILAFQGPGAEPRPVAMLSSWQSGQEGHVSVQRLVLPEGGDGAAVNVATLEHLYALAMRQEPEARFRLANGTQPCEVAKDGHSHAKFLRDLARERQRAVAEAGRPSVSAPWHVVSMAPAAMSGPVAGQVGVRIMSDQGPMEGASIFFNRAPHSSCVAKSREDGIAICQLVDQHEDDDSHREGATVPVVATYPGDVRDGRVLIPTTLVMQSAP